MTVEKKIHSDRGASNSARWMNCPGSTRLIKLAPPDAGNQAAAQGTVAHAVAANVLEIVLLHMLSGKEYAPTYTVGQVVTIDKDGKPAKKGTPGTFDVEVDAEMIEHVDAYRGFIVGMIEEYDLRPHQVGIEKEVCITGVETPEGEDDLWGTADAILYVPYNRLIVVDLKYGFKPVSVQKNSQTLFYLLGAYLALPADEQADVNLAEAIIYQPRAIGGGISSVEVPISELLAFWQELKDASKCITPDAPVTAGPWCDWCPAQKICPAFAGLLKEVIALDYKDVAPVKLPETSQMTIEMLEKVVVNQSGFEKFMENCAGELQRRLEAGEVSKTHKLVQKTGHRKWLDEENAKRVLSAILPVSDVLTEPKLKTPAKIEEALKKAGQLSTAVKTLAYVPNLGIKLDVIGSKAIAVKPGTLTD